MIKKSIKLKNNLYLDTNSIIHEKKNLKEKLNLIGSTAVFYKTDEQSINSKTITQIKFNKNAYVDNDAFELQSDGTIKVLQNITRVLCTVNIRCTPVGGIVYVNGEHGGFNIEKSVASGSSVFNGSGVIEVSKGSKISIVTYQYQAGKIVGYDRNWCGVTLTILK